MALKDSGVLPQAPSKYLSDAPSPIMASRPLANVPLVTILLGSVVSRTPSCDRGKISSAGFVANMLSSAYAKVKLEHRRTKHNKIDKILFILTSYLSIAFMVEYIIFAASLRRIDFSGANSPVS